MFSVPLIAHCTAPVFAVADNVTDMYHHPTAIDIRLDGDELHARSVQQSRHAVKHM